MVGLLDDLLRPWADEVIITEAAPGRPNFMAKFHGLDRTQCHAFEAHSDTVGIEGMGIEPFAGRIEAGRLYGRGACDTKGPMTAMILAILHHLGHHGLPPTDLLFISTCDEELGGLGARALIADGFRCDGLIVGEPTELVPLQAHKGAARFRVKVRGRAAHSAYPELGSNAVHAASALVCEIDEVFRKLAAQDSWPEPGPPTVSVGTFHGGEQVNRIPDLVTLELDTRIPLGWDAAAVPALLGNCVDRVSATCRDIRIEMEQTQFYPPFRLEPESPFRTKMAPLARRGQGPSTARYATNAGFFASAETPCTVFGPGSSSHAHTADESIDLSEVAEGIEILGRFIRQ